MIFQSIPIADIRLSDTPAQCERRARFDKAALAELADSIKSIGLQQPIVVRKVFGNGELRPSHVELVAGERRLLAAKQAGLKSIDAIVRELTDQQVIEVQLVENLQREGLHELAEAEGYEALMKQHRFTVEDLVAKVGKSKAYVYARLKLTALCPEARKAFYAGKLTASTALLIARIPVHDLQRQALKEITKPNTWNDQPLSYRAAAEHVHKHYMLELARAPFPTGDADLVPKAGPCGSCPKRTGNQKELFGDVKGADVCTDPVCFAAKRDANAVRLAAAAEASGKTVIAGTAAKKIAPDGIGTYDRLKGYVRLEERFWSGNKQRTYRSAIGKDVEVQHLQDPETGKLVEIVPEAEAKTALKKHGIKDNFSGSSSSGYQAEQRAKDRRRRIETQFRRRLLETIRPKLSTRLGRPELELIAAAFWRRRQNDTQKEILNLWGLEPAKRQYGVDVEKPMRERIPKMTDADLALLLQDLVYAADLQVWTYSNEGPRHLLAAARRVKVNAEQIRRQVQAELTPKKKPAKRAAKHK